jgi:hypothetical protein
LRPLTAAGFTFLAIFPAGQIRTPQGQAGTAAGQIIEKSLDSNFRLKAAQTLPVYKTSQTLRLWVCDTAETPVN